MELYLHERHATRRAPVAISDAVELFARQHGGHGTIVWVPEPVRCWQVRLSLKPGDPRLRSDNDSTHFESVMLHEWLDPVATPSHPRVHLCRRHPHLKSRLMPCYVPIDLDELGASGVTAMLERGSILSGRGEFQSAEHALRVIMDRTRDIQINRRATQRDNARERTKDMRRQVLKIPFVNIGIDISRKTKEVTP